MSTTEPNDGNKSYWGYGIAAVYLCFMIMILTLVFLSSSQKFELVSDDYYEESINYQKVIDAQSRAESLAEKPYLLAGKNTIVIPPALLENFLEAQIKIFRPDNATLDKLLKVTPDENGRFTLPNLQKGSWQFFLKWQDQKQLEYRQHWKTFL